jgi:hypothetical protein
MALLECSVFEVFRRRAWGGKTDGMLGENHADRYGKERSA